MSKIQSAFWLCNKYIDEYRKAQKHELSSKNIGWIDIIVDFPTWFISQHKTHKFILPKKPWLPYPVVRKLSNDLKLDKLKVFEYGAGASTMFFLEKGCEVISVEHDKNWFDIVANKVAEQGYKTWHGYYKSPEHSNSNINEIFKSHLKEYNHQSFERYVNTIQDFPDQYFDIVLIDGRIRNTCFQFALPKVKQGGLILWDNVERGRYNLERIRKENKFSVEIIGGPTPGVNFFTWTAFISKIPEIAKV